MKTTTNPTNPTTNPMNVFTLATQAIEAARARAQYLEGKLQPLLEKRARVETYCRDQLAAIDSEIAGLMGDPAVAVVPTSTVVPAPIARPAAVHSTVHPAVGKFRKHGVKGVSMPFRARDDRRTFVNLSYEDGETRTYTIGAIEKNKGRLAKVVGTDHMRTVIAAAYKAPGKAESAPVVDPVVPAAAPVESAPLH